MRSLTLLSSLALLTLAAGSLRAADKAPVLVWSDDFKQPEGTGPSLERWSFDLGANGWGNREWERYTADPENCQVVHDDQASDHYALAIKAIKTDTGYTSARIKSAGKYAFTYGRVEARMRLTTGQGIWPAFWLLGENVRTLGWPRGGEIDIMENIGSRPGTVYGTLHGPGYSGDHGIQGVFTLPEGHALAEGYHVYALDWAPDSLRWSVDGQVYHTVTPASLPKGAPWVYNDAKFFIILNLAVGGNWPKFPDKSTVFPQTLYIDYVRVYQTPKS